MSTIDDQIEIQTLAQTYAHGVMTRDPEIWSSTWAEDGVWYLGTPDPIKGRDTILQVWQGAMGGYPVVLHIVQPGVIDVDGETATARWYIHESIVTADGEQIYNMGVYNDTLKKENGAWKFASRRFNSMYRGPADLTGSLDGYKAYSA
jgi:uncharacterized protein (TIGR02246 family)